MAFKEDKKERVWNDPPMVPEQKPPVNNEETLKSLFKDPVVAEQVIATIDRQRHAGYFLQWSIMSFIVAVFILILSYTGATTEDMIKFFLIAGVITRVATVLVSTGIIKTGGNR